MAAGEKGREPQATSLLVSVMFHGFVVLGIAVSSWWWGPSALDTWKTYSVSLVDAPLSSQPPSLSPVSPSPAPTPPPPASKPVAKPAAKPKSPTVAEPKQVPSVAPPAKPPAKPPTKPKAAKPAPPRAEPTLPAPKREVKSTPSPQPKPQPKPPARVQKPQAPRVATSQEARSAIEALRQQQAQREQAQRDSEADQQQAASDRVAALRDQLAKAQSAGAAASLRRARLIAYQDQVRARIVEAWILPLSAEQTRDLQATALFEVTREGRVMQLELVKPSGNGLFDASLLRAIRRASPLPTLPDDYPVDVLEVEMRFRAES